MQAEVVGAQRVLRQEKRVSSAGREFGSIRPPRLARLAYAVAQQRGIAAVSLQPVDRSPGDRRRRTRADGCQIAVNASLCTALLSFTTTNATLPMLKVGVPLVSASHAAADFPVNIGHGSLAVVLSDGSTVLDGSASVSGACVAGSTWDGNACKAGR